MGSPQAQAPHPLGLGASVSTPFPGRFPGCPAHPPSHSPLQPSTTPELALCPGVPWWGAGSHGGQRRGWASLSQHGLISRMRAVGTGGLQVPRVAFSLEPGPFPHVAMGRRRRYQGGLRVSPARAGAEGPSQQAGRVSRLVNSSPCDVRAPGVSPPASGLGISLSGCWG